MSDKYLHFGFAKITYGEVIGNLPPLFRYMKFPKAAKENFGGRAAFKFTKYGCA